jgi:nucleotide-binding universal stress UspA family protein
MTPYTVLVPLDNSAFSQQIIPYVCRLLIPREHSIMLLRVEQPLLDYTTWSSQWSGNDSLATLPDWVTGEDPELARHPSFASHVLENLRDALFSSMEPSSTYLEQAGFSVTRNVRFGDPVEEIVALAQEARVDLIAMATHGRSGLSRMTLGSTADAVMRRSHVPVLMVRPTPSTRERSHAEAATEPA